MGEAEREDGAAVGATQAAGTAPAPDTAGEEKDTRSPEEIERDIERTREELGDTVAALAEKADVKARAKDKVDEVKGNITGKKDEVTAKAKEKKDEFASKAQDASPSSVDPQQVAQTAKQTAQKTVDKPPALAGVAFAAGFLLGVLVARRRS